MSAPTLPRAGRAPQLDPREYETSFGEFIGIGPNGNLWVDGCDVAELVERFGSPLFIMSENQLRYTYRSFRDAFREHYPNSEILFANKSNNGLAIRHIMNQEGAGGDCFGNTEMYLALLAGTDPKTLVLNGSNKEDEELAFYTVESRERHEGQVHCVELELDAQEHDDRVAADEHTGGTDHEQDRAEHQRLRDHAGLLLARTSAPTIATRSRIPVISNATT